MDISIIIVNYNSAVKLKACLDSLGRAELNGLETEIIVVDNASGDDLSFLSEKFPAVKLIVSRKNLGMGGGNNLGIEAASGRYILVLNPDTLIFPETIRLLYDLLEKSPDVGLAAPKLLNTDKTLQFSCSRFPDFFLPFWRRTFLGRFFPGKIDDLLMKEYDHSHLLAVDWLMGSCLFFRRSCQSANGHIFVPRFDERYFMYFEDTDLARQFWSNGWRVVYYPEAVIIHDHQRQSAKHPWYLAIFLDRLARRHIASWLKYFIKWGFARPDYQNDCLK